MTTQSVPTDRIVLDVEIAARKPWSAIIRKGQTLRITDTHGQQAVDTLVYCAHEYTEANARFARTVERHNPDLLARIEEIKQTRRHHRPTVPMSLGIERKTNPFLRADQPDL